MCRYKHVLPFILVITQLHSQNLLNIKFISCLYMFRATPAHRQEVKIVLYTSGIITAIGGRPVFDDPRVSRRWAHEGGKTVNLKHRPTLPLRMSLVLISVGSCVDYRAIVRPESVLLQRVCVLVEHFQSLGVTFYLRFQNRILYSVQLYVVHSLIYLKIEVFWDFGPCLLVNRYRRFVET